MDEPAKPWGELFSLTVAILSTTVEEMHTAIVQPWFRMAGPFEPELRKTHVRTTSGVYRSVRTIASLAGQVADRVRRGSSATHLPRSDAVQAFANALFGDELESRGSLMAIQMEVRDRGGGAVTLDPASLAAAFPDASGRLVVLLHGLGQTESCFRGRDNALGLTEALAAASFTPVPVRYNTGRAVAANGYDLSVALDQLVANWPVPVTSIALVGYSMGGLVSRAAIASGRSHSSRWAESARYLVTIATPHAGSPIEKGVAVTSQALMFAPQSRPLGGFLERRSSGIRDLHSGVNLPPAFAGVDHLAIGSVMTGDVSHPIGSLFGDLVVRPGSATGGTAVAATDHVLIGGRRHNDILIDPATARLVLDWIDQPPR